MLQKYHKEMQSEEILKKYLSQLTTFVFYLQGYSTAAISDNFHIQRIFISLLCLGETRGLEPLI